MILSGGARKINRKFVSRSVEPHGMDPGQRGKVAYFWPDAGPFRSLRHRHRASRPPSCLPCASLSASVLCRANGVPQRAHAVDLDLDDITRLEEDGRLA